MTRDEAQKIVTQALFLISKDKPDAELFGSPDLFGDFMFHAINTMHPTHEVTRTDQLGVRINRRDDRNSGALMSFERLFDKLGKLGRADDNSQLVEAVTIVGSNIEASLSEDDDTDLTKAIPVLRSTEAMRLTLERNRERADERGIDPAMNEIIHWPASEGLTAVLAVPEEDSYVFVTEDMRLESGLSVEELKATAMSNLREGYLSARSSFHRVGTITEIVRTGGAASSFILLDGFLEKLSRKAGSDLLIYSGETDHLLVIPTKTQTAVVNAVNRYAAGKLPAGDIPQMLYSGGELRPITRDDIVSLVSNVFPAHGSRQPRHLHRQQPF